ncbi:MAG: type 4a pilus biogenesis protein PilO [Pelagibacterales bacterium]|nr:type 4a pilus biogenesis protein PilO [Pelagibacterales bacterium]
MDLSNLKNIDVNDLVDKLKSGNIGDKKILIQIGIGFAAVLIFLIGYYVFVSPILANQEKKINQMIDNKNNINKYNDRIVELSDVVKKLRPEYNNNSKLFHNKKETVDLYQNISKFASKNGLLITKFDEGEHLAVLSQDTDPQEEIYIKIPVEYEIQGNFLSYLKFRRALSKSNKVINFDREEINSQEEIQGQILAKLTISIVGLPDEYN